MSPVGCRGQLDWDLRLGTGSMASEGGPYGTKGQFRSPSCFCITLRETYATGAYSHSLPLAGHFKVVCDDIATASDIHSFCHRHHRALQGAVI